MLRGKAYCKRQSKEWRVRPLVVRPKRARGNLGKDQKVRLERQPLKPHQEETKLTNQQRDREMVSIKWRIQP